MGARAAHDERQPPHAMALRDVLPGELGIALQLELADRFGDVDHLVADTPHLLGRRLARPEVHVLVDLARVRGDDHRLDAEVPPDSSGQLDR
jgi:hypothetical protein